MSKNLFERVEELKSIQTEIVEAIEARVGPKGHAYCDIVKKTAATVAVCIHAGHDQASDPFDEILAYAGECVIICGTLEAAHLMGHLGEGNLPGAFQDEFTGDVKALVKKSSMRVNRDEMDDIVRGEDE